MKTTLLIGLVLQKKQVDFNEAHLAGLKTFTHLVPVQAVEKVPGKLSDSLEPNPFLQSVCEGEGAFCDSSNHEIFNSTVGRLKQVSAYGTADGLFTKNDGWYWITTETWGP